MLARFWRGWILCSCRCPCRYGHNASVNLQQEKCYFHFIAFYLYIKEKCYILKGKAWEAVPWEWAIFYYSGYRWHFLQSWKAEPAWLSTDNREKGFKKIGSKWSQFYSSLLQMYCCCCCCCQVASVVLTLCDPIDGSPSGSPVPEILQARTLEWVAISFSQIASFIMFWVFYRGFLCDLILSSIWWHRKILINSF